MPSSYSQYAAGVANLAQTKAVPCLVLPGEGLSLDLQQFRMAQLTKQALKWETLPWRSEEKLWPMRWPLSFSFTCPYLCESKMWFSMFRMLCENTQLFPSFISERQLEKKPSVILAAVALPLSMSYSWPGTRISCETPALNRAPWGSAAWRDCHGDHYLCREKPTGCFQGKLHRNVTLAVLDKNNTPRWFKVTEDSWSLLFFVLIWKFLGMI